MTTQFQRTAAPAVEDPMDQLRIQEVTSRLGRCLDERDFEGLRLIFTEDAQVATPGGVAAGHDALVEQARMRLPRFDGQGS